MGELSEEEMKEVDRIVVEHSIVREELEKIRANLNVYAAATGKQPVEEVLQKVFSALNDESKAVQSPAFQAQTLRHKVHKFPTWRVAATVLLLISLIFNLYFFYELEDSKEQIESLVSDRIALSERAESTARELDLAELRIAHFLNEDNIHVRMDGSDISPQSFANVFWNKRTNAVFISVDNLPEPPHGHQYQLWAIKPGQPPIDAGIFDHNDRVQKLKVIRGEVEAFAVTLEKLGGTQNATVEKTYVKGFLQKS